MNEVTDQQIIEEAVRLVNEGLAVTMLVKGRSMLPFILGGQESAVLTAPGDVRAACTRSGISIRATSPHAFPRISIRSAMPRLPCFPAP